MAIIRVPVVEFDADGRKIINLCSNALDADPIRAERLFKRAAAGDESAKREIEELENEPMVWDTDFDIK